MTKLPGTYVLNRIHVLPAPNQAQAYTAAYMTLSVEALYLGAPIDMNTSSHMKEYKNNDGQLAST